MKEYIIETNLDENSRDLHEYFEVSTFDSKGNTSNARTYTDLIKSILPESEIHTTSKSKQLSQTFHAMQESNEVIPPPIDVDLAAAMLEKSTRLNRAVHTYARNVVGLGFHIVPNIDLSESTDEEKAKFKQEKRTLETLLESPNPDMPLVNLLFLTKLDQEATGNGYIEVVRNGSGVIQNLFHMPSITVRVRTEDKGFVQIVDDKRRFFKKFGDNRIMDCDTGEFVSNPIPIAKQATEVLHFKIPCVRSCFYGLPRWVPSIPAITGNRLAAIRNVSFFENDTTPRMIITINGGGRLSPDSVEEIRKFLNVRAKGVENAHRVAVIQLDQKRTNYTDNTPAAQINITPLTVGTAEDASFLNYRLANDEEIRESFGIGKVFFTLDDVSRAGGRISRMITNESEFEPDRVYWEWEINQKIVKDFGLEFARFKLARPDLSDALETAKIDKLLADAGALSPNDIRQRHSMPNFPDSFDFATKPIRVAMEEAKPPTLKPLTSGPLSETAEQEREENLQHPERVGVPRQDPPNVEQIPGHPRRENPTVNRNPPVLDVDVNSRDVRQSLGLASMFYKEKDYLEKKYGVPFEIHVNGNKFDPLVSEDNGENVQ